MLSWLLFFIFVFAIYRVTHLVVKSNFPPVSWFRKQVRKLGTIVAFTVDCFVCAATLVSFGTVATFFSLPWRADLLLAAGLSGAVSVLYSLVHRTER